MQEQAKDSATLTPLENFYLGIIAAVAESEKLTSIIRRVDESTGQIYLCRTGTTKPDAVVQFQFLPLSVKLGIQHVNGQQHVEDYAYAGGIDKFMPEMVKVIHAGLLASKVAPRKAEGMTGAAARRAEAQALRIEAQQV